MAQEMRAVSIGEKERARMLQEMTPALQEMVQDLATRVAKGAAGLIMLYHTIGSRASAAAQSPTEYGPDAVVQLAAYLNIQTDGWTSINTYRNFAETFDRQFVAQQSERLTANGERISVNHWVTLARVSDEARRLTLLERVFTESMSVNDLRMELRAKGGGRHTRQGGRKPMVPKNPVECLQKTYQLANQFHRFAADSDSVMSELAQIPPDRVDERLVERLKTAQAAVDQTVKTATVLQGRLSEAVTRAERVLKSSASGEKETKPKGKGAADKPKADKQADKPKADKPAKAGRAAKKATVGAS